MGLPEGAGGGPGFGGKKLRQKKGQRVYSKRSQIGNLFLYRIIFTKDSKGSRGKKKGREKETGGTEARETPNGG